MLDRIKKAANSVSRKFQSNPNSKAKADQPTADEPTADPPQGEEEQILMKDLPGDYLKNVPGWFESDLSFVQSLFSGFVEKMANYAENPEQGPPVLIFEDFSVKRERKAKSDSIRFISSDSVWKNKKVVTVPVEKQKKGGKKGEKEVEEKELSLERALWTNFRVIAVVLFLMVAKFDKNYLHYRATIRALINMTKEFPASTYGNETEKENLNEGYRQKQLCDKLFESGALRSGSPSRSAFDGLITNLRQSFEVYAVDRKSSSRVVHYEKSRFVIPAKVTVAKAEELVFKAQEQFENAYDDPEKRNAQQTASSVEPQRQPRTPIRPRTQNLPSASAGESQAPKRPQQPSPSRKDSEPDNRGEKHEKGKFPNVDRFGKVQKDVIPTESVASLPTFLAAATALNHPDRNSSVSQSTTILSENSQYSI